MVEWTMQLNNILQAAGTKDKLSYEGQLVGPHNDGIWKVTAKYNSQEVGKGSAKVKQQAKEQASEEAMRHLYPTQYAALKGN